MVPPVPLSHVRVVSTSFDEEPIPLLEDSGYLSQSISLEPSPSVFLESGSVLPTPVKSMCRRRDQEVMICKEVHPIKAKSVAHHQMPQTTPSPTTRCRPTSPSSTVSPEI